MDWWRSLCKHASGDLTSSNTWLATSALASTTGGAEGEMSRRLVAKRSMMCRMW